MHLEKAMHSDEIRSRYLKFFEKRGHKIIPSASLVPPDDPTTLFTGSGMQPLVPYLLGEIHPEGKRLADSQKSLRAQDIEEVGDNRHTTFFEMLGNWSLGDYFKKEQIPWMFQFVVEEVGLDSDRLYFTCFRGNQELGIPKDEESAFLWQRLLTERGVTAQIVDFSEREGMQGGRIFYYDEKKNWWSRFGPPQEMPLAEPGGPDSEMFWDFGTSWKLHEISPWRDQHCHVNCDCGRFMEIGNNVFMEYARQESGFVKLQQQNVDFGGGLERTAAARRDNPDIFMIDLFERAREALQVLTGKKYGEDVKATRAQRIILDHMRAAAFLIAEGLRPSNIERGYILRRLLRRALRYATLLGLKSGWYTQVVEAFIQTYRGTYPEIAKPEEINKVIAIEYEKFEKALERGLKEFEKIARAGPISGKQAFDIYQSYGFPIEMIGELALEQAVTVDKAGFSAEFTKHQEISRAGREKKFGGHGLLLDTGELKAGNEEELKKVLRLHTVTHLMHWALREVLGKEVAQMGSDITPERTRFDFTLSRKMTPEEIKEVEAMVNGKIQADFPVTFKEMPKSEAEKTGALHFFKLKYPDTVKVYYIGHDLESALSKEFCGGPHVEHTGEIGKFRILKEESASAGVRRVRATVEP